MSRKPLKSAALLTLVGFFLLSVPGLYSAPSTDSKFDFRILIKKPAAWISSVMSFFTPIFGQENTDTPRTINADSSGSKIKPAGPIGMGAGRPSTGD